MVVFCAGIMFGYVSAEEQYQDIIVNGKVVSYGVRGCAERYEAIKPILDKYKRPITVLDIGASQGYFSFRIAHDYPSVCVMIEGGYNDKWHTPDKLLELCKRNTDLDNIVFLKKRVTAGELEQLARCEHFDVVLAFNVAHHFKQDWKRVANAFLALGDTVIIETPSAQDAIAQKNSHVGKLERYLLSKNGTLILEPPRHTDNTAKGKMLWFEKRKKHIARKYWLNEVDITDRYEITSNYTTKKLYKKDLHEYVNWKPGINLLTFKMLNGAYPTKGMIKEKVRVLKSHAGLDFMIWNMILQGESIALIDQNDPRYPLDLEKCFAFTMGMIEQNSPKQVKQYHKENFEAFWINKGYMDDEESMYPQYGHSRFGYPQFGRRPRVRVKIK